MAVAMVIVAVIIAVIITIIIIITGSGNQFPELHTIIWKGQGKANKFCKREQDLYPSVPRI